MEERGKVKRLLTLPLAIAAFLFIFCHFFNNRWQMNPYDTLYRNWQLDSEELVVNKIMDARSHGIGNYNGMMVDYQQQIGFAGLLFSVVDKLVERQAGLTEPIPKNVMCGLNVFCFTVLFFVFLYWLCREFGILTACVVYVTALYTHWMGFTAKNLYWVTWTMILPMIALLVLMMWEEKRHRQKDSWLFALSFFFIFLRSACGYEFISCVMVALELPPLYYAVKQRWGWEKYIKRAFLAGAGAVGGFLGALSVNIALMAGLKGWKGAVDYLVYVSAKRTGYASLEGFDVDVLASFEVPLLEVFRRYLQENNGYAIFIRWNLDLLVPCFLGLAAVTVLIWRFTRGKAGEKGWGSIGQGDIRMLGLNMMMAASLLGPVSWLVLAKGHAVHHQHINYIIFSLPFTMLGFASAAQNIGWCLRKGREQWFGRKRAGHEER